MRFLAFLPLLLTFGGCAVSHYDARTGTAHLWGIGHLKMRVTPAEDNPKVQAIAIGTQTVGARLDTSKDLAGFSLGYQDTRLVAVVASETALRLDTARGDLFTLRLGTQFPAPTFTHP